MNFLSHHSLRPIGRVTVGVILALLAACFSSTSYASVWTGGGADNEFSTVANWDDMGINGTQDINTAVTVDRSVSNTNERTFVSGGATLNVIGGTQSDNRSGANIYNFVGNNSAGTVNQSGGTYGIGHALRVGGGNANSDGVFNLSGGALDVFRGSNSNIQGGTDRPSLQIGSPTAGAQGLLEISGGSLITRFGSHVGDGGIVSVVGSGASSIAIGNNSNGDGHWVQRAGGTLKATVDGGGLTPIFIDDNGDDGANVFAEFEAGSILDVSFGMGVTHVPGTWTVMEVENADVETTGTGSVTGNTLGLGLTAMPGWSYAVDNSGDNGLLLAIYTVPEPSSLALLGLAVVGFLLRRRRN